VGVVIDDSDAVAAITAIRDGDVAALARLLEAGRVTLPHRDLTGSPKDVLLSTSSVTGRATSPMDLLSSRCSSTPELIRTLGAPTTNTVRPHFIGPQAATTSMLR
jgi:hypothetical protein